jgi:hypothetical protein
VAPPWPGTCAVAGTTTAVTTDEYKIHKPINDGFFVFTTFSSDCSWRLDAFVNKGSPPYGRFQAMVLSPLCEPRQRSRN